MADRSRAGPTRTCVACRTARPKRELVRVVRTPSGEVRLDDTGRANGRGAYLCRQDGCWTTAATKPILERALSVRLDDEIRQRLAAGPGAAVPSHHPESQPAAAVAADPTKTEGGARGQE